MTGLKFFLKDIAFLLAVYLILKWTGANFEWFQWLIIAVAIAAMNLIGTNRGIDVTVEYFMDRMQPCNDPNCKGCSERKAESNAN